MTVGLAGRSFRRDGSLEVRVKTNTEGSEPASVKLVAGERRVLGDLPLPVNRFC